MKARRDRIVRLATDIGALRLKLFEMESELDSLIARNDEMSQQEKIQQPTTKDDGQGVFATKGQFMPGSLAARVFERMNSEPNREFTTKDFCDLEGNPSDQGIRGALFRMSESKRIRKVRRGFYVVNKMQGD